MARPDTPLDWDRVGAAVTRALTPLSAEAKRSQGLHERFPLDPDLAARGLDQDD